MARLPPPLSYRYLITEILFVLHHLTTYDLEVHSTRPPASLTHTHAQTQMPTYAYSHPCTTCTNTHLDPRGRGGINTFGIAVYTRRVRAGATESGPSPYFFTSCATAEHPQREALSCCRHYPHSLFKDGDYAPCRHPGHRRLSCSVRSKDSS